MINLIHRQTEILRTDLYGPYLPIYAMRDDLFADEHNYQIIKRLSNRVRFPSAYDEDLLLAIRDCYSSLTTYSTNNLSEDKLLYLIYLLDNLSLFNLNYIRVGQIPEESFKNSAFITFCIKGKSNLQETKLILAKDSYVYCMFNNYMKLDLIVILRLDTPIDDFDLYRQVFEYYARSFENKYAVDVLNFDHPLAFFYFSMDEEIYNNWKSEWLPIDKALKNNENS